MGWILFILAVAVVVTVVLVIVAIVQDLDDGLVVAARKSEPPRREFERSKDGILLITTASEVVSAGQSLCAVLGGDRLVLVAHISRFLSGAGPRGLPRAVGRRGAGFGALRRRNGTP